MMLSPVITTSYYRKVILICIILISGNNLFSQQPKDSSIIAVKYKFTFVQDTLDMKSVIYEPMVLLTNGKKSVYYSENHKDAVEGFSRMLKEAGRTGNTIDPTNLPKAKVRHSVYKDDNTTYISNYLGTAYYTFKSPDVLDWKIESIITENIAGYKCTKATVKVGGKVFVAWFTYDIPLSDGPYKFRGLPGLILKVNDTGSFTVFEVISLTKASLPIVQKKGIEVTREQYLSKRNEFMSDPLQGRVNNPEYRNRIKANRLRYNNSLE